MVTLWSNNRFSNLAQRIRNRVLRSSDPLVVTKVNSQKIVCPFSHMLVIYQKQFPLYDKQLKNICDVIFAISGKLSVIDVGANIGDTVINIGNKQGYYLLVEGELRYKQCIQRNLRKYKYDLECSFLTDYLNEDSYICKTINGTGHLEKSTVPSVRMNTLDNILKNQYSHTTFDILKIDTDGFDFKVLRGSRLFLQEQHPLVFFEWDKDLLHIQGEEYMSIFPFLVNLGYAQLLIFDNFGKYITTISSDNYKLLQEIADKIDSMSVFYYDILAIPNKWISAKEKIYSMLCR